MEPPEDPPEPEQHYCFMIRHNLEGKKRNTFISYHIDPVKDTYDRNTGKITDKETNLSTSHWRIDMIIGPFSNEARCQALCHTWKNRARGPKSKRQLGVTLARQNKVDCYSATCPVTPEQEIEFLKANCPDDYVPQIMDMYQSVLEKK